MKQILLHLTMVKILFIFIWDGTICYLNEFQTLDKPRFVFNNVNFILLQIKRLLKIDHVSQIFQTDYFLIQIKMKHFEANFAIGIFAICYFAISYWKLHVKKILVTWSIFNDFFIYNKIKLTLLQPNLGLSRVWNSFK